MCGNKKIGDKLRKPIGIIKQYFFQHGCELLSETYKNTYELLDYRCRCGNIAQITFRHFQDIKKCELCRKSQRLTYDFVKSCFAKEGCELLETNYKNTLTPMKYKCACGNISKINFSNFQMGKRCKKCGTTIRNPRWIKDRSIAKANYVFSSRCRNMLFRCLKKTGHQKTYLSKEHLGYTHKQLLSHIMQHENWMNVKDKQWHIDHVFPIRAFLDHDIHDVKLINCLDNLRPISQEDNQLKSDKYDKSEFQQWLNGKL